MNTIEAQEKYLSFKGDQYYALDLINSLRESYGSKDMPKMLNDFVFNLEVALQNAGVLDQDFKLIEEVKLTKKYKVTLGRTEHLQQVIEVEANNAELANEMAWDLSGDWKCVDTEEFLDGIECLKEDTGLHEVECLKCEHVWTEVIYFKVCPKCGNDDVMQTIYLQKGEE
jgi:hypothetical protein